MADNVVKAMNARREAIDKLQGSFDVRREALMREMAALNDRIIDLQREQNTALDALMREYDAISEKARQDDLAEEDADRRNREKKDTVSQQAKAKASSARR
jgi:peptidoglycan hydrolase CwlO-like protein